MYQWKLPSFHVQFLEEELEVFPFYELNVTFEWIKNAVDYKSALAAQ